MNDLCETHQDFFHLMAANTKGETVYDEVYFSSVDAEWHPVDGRNNVLSYQTSTVSRSTANNIIHYMPLRKRMRLIDLVESGIVSVNGNSLPPFRPKRKILVVLVAHNFTAEWSVFADRDAPYITKNLRVVRKTPITGRRPIKLNLSDSTPVDVLFFDTMHLAPADYKSLQALSTLLGDPSLEKDDVPQFYKENMHLFLREHPKWYERYALRDTEVTLRLFFLLQRSLNLLAFGELRQLFHTLSAAASAALLEENPWFEDYRKALRGQYFWNATRIAERAYHGGRNEGFFVGKTGDYAETRHKIWVDIDFSGCYPTAMALCPKIDTEESQ